MHKLLMGPIVSAFILLSHISNAQFIEYGGGIGGMNYAGDLSRGYKITKQNPAIHGVYRLNLSEIVSLKFGLAYGKISGDDNDPIDVLGASRNASFSRTLIEASTTFEYHFLDYKNEKSLIKWSPYFFAGFGFFKLFNLDKDIDNFSSIQPVLPFGVGFKHLIGKQFSVGIEFGARKTFFDELDRVSDGDIFQKNFQYGNPNDKDWYHFTGITITYILYKIPCPFRYIPNKSIYD